MVTNEIRPFRDFEDYEHSLIIAGLEPSKPSIAFKGKSRNLEATLENSVICEAISLFGIWLRIVEKEQKNKDYEFQFKEKLRRAHMKYFPLSTKDILKGSNEENSLKKTINASLKMIELSQKFELIEYLFPLLKEKGSIFEKKFEKFIDEFLATSFKSYSGEKQQDLIDAFYGKFLDEELDSTPFDNARTALGRKLLLPMLDNCENFVLRTFFIKNAKNLETMMKKKFPDIANLELLCLEIDIKTFVFELFAKIYQLSDQGKPEATRSQIQQYHKKIFGEECKGNELTQSIILAADAAKSKPVDRDEQIKALKGFNTAELLR